HIFYGIFYYCFDSSIIVTKSGLFVIQVVKWVLLNSSKSHSLVQSKCSKGPLKIYTNALIVSFDKRSLPYIVYVPGTGSRTVTDKITLGYSYVLLLLLKQREKRKKDYIRTGLFFSE